MNFQDLSSPRITEQINILELKKAKTAKINLHSFKNATESLNSVLMNLRENRGVEKLTTIQYWFKISFLSDSSQWSRYKSLPLS